MGKPTLYLMLGYPGAGKTTVSRLVAAETGATHLWADGERHRMFDRPTHGHKENLKLYDRLNAMAEELLAGGQSVVFDTSFNLYDDRQKLRDIAKQKGAETVIIWLSTPQTTARQRAVHGPVNRNGYDDGMSAERFGRLAGKLEPPRENEKFIKIDGTELDEAALIRLIKP